MKNSNYVVCRFIWKDDVWDEHEVPRNLTNEFVRRRETRCGRSSENAPPGVTAVRFRKIGPSVDPNLPVVYVEV
jgi:hypothetical protein